jgi:4-hydroxyphenylpyruvate dioxygenase-like putative hemolysin
MITWPGTLPTLSTEEGYSETQMPSAVIRTQTDTGPPKQRNRFTAFTKVYTVTFQMTSAQLDTFWTFYRETLGNGALSFYSLPEPRTGASVQSRIDTSTPPQVKRQGYDTFLVSMTLEVLPI